MKNKKYIFYLSEEDRKRLEAVKEKMESPSMTEAVRQTIRVVYKMMKEDEKGELVQSN